MDFRRGLRAGVGLFVGSCCHARCGLHFGQSDRRKAIVGQ